MNEPVITHWDASANYRRIIIAYPYDLGGEYELYQEIIRYRDREKLVGYIGLRFRNEKDNEIRHINILNDDLESFASFQDKIHYIASADDGTGNTGSDRWLNDTAKNWSLITQVFTTDSFDYTGGTKRRALNIFRELKVVKVKGKNKCGLAVVKTIQSFIHSLKFDEKLDYSKYDNIYKVASDNGISIINNAILPIKKRFFNPKNWDNAEDWKFRGTTHRLAYINHDTWKPDFLYIGENKQFTIVYDNQNQHFSLIKGEIRLRDDIRINKTSIIYQPCDKQGYKLLMKPTENYRRQSIKNNTERVYLMFDFETIADPFKANAMRPYSISFLALNEQGLEDIIRDDEDGETERWEEQAECYVGWDCCERFLEKFIELQQDSIITLMSFNGVNFDNYLLLNAILLREDRQSPYQIEKIQYNGSQLLNFKINGRHDLFDLGKHLCGSLKECCEGFEVKSMAKGAFNHNEIQETYEKDPDNFIEGLDKEALIKYNKYDCISLAIIYKKYKNELLKIPIINPLATRLHEYKTIGSLIMKVFKNHIEKLGIELDTNLDEKVYNDMLKDKVAGRVEMFNGIQVINERMSSLDITSLYPFVLSLLKCHYPHGKLEKCNHTLEEIIEDERIGFFYCDIDQSDLKKKNLPLYYCKKTKEGCNDWEEPIIENVFISTIAIKKLKQLKCKVKILNKGNGYYFPNLIKSIELFGFLVELMKIKNEQDQLKKMKSPKYNPVLRETIKLLSNAISGKIIEGLHLDATEVGSIKLYSKLLSEGRPINCINVLGDRVFFNYKKDFEENKDRMRPVYLGILCYDQARTFMYNHIYTPTGLDKLVYTDTDASKCRYVDRPMKYLRDTKMINLVWEEALEVEPKYKHLSLYQEGDKAYGCFEEELYKDNFWFCCVQKKMYVSISITSKPKASMKGLNPKSIILTEEQVNMINKWLDPKTITKHSWNYRKSEVQRVFAKLYRDGDMRIEDNFKYLFELFIKNAKENKPTPILCMSFKKKVKSLSKATTPEEEEKFLRNHNCIEVVHSIKNIRLKDIEKFNTI